MLRVRIDKTTPAVTEEKKLLKSYAGSDCCYVNQPRKKGLGYLCGMTVDTSSGITTSADCFGANRRESDSILKHLQKQQERMLINTASCVIFSLRHTSYMRENTV